MTQVIDFPPRSYVDTEEAPTRRPEPQRFYGQKVSKSVRMVEKEPSEYGLLFGIVLVGVAIIGVVVGVMHFCA